MRLLLLASLLFALTGCGNDKVAAGNVAVPDLNQRSETPGDWSDLRGMIGRTPSDSGLFVRSPITIDLDSLLGPDARAYRLAMGDAGPLRADGPLLVMTAPDGQAYLLILPRDHALEAGLRKRDGWRVVRTPGAEVPRPASVARLLRS